MKKIMKLALMALIANPSIVSASVIYATSTTLKSAWSIAKSGDTIKLEGKFGLESLQYKTASPPITIDATKATFTDSLKINYVDGIKIVGGTFDSRGGPTTYGRAIVVYNSANLSFDKQNIIGPGEHAGQGIALNYVTNASVTNGTFTNLGLGVGVGASTNVVISSNKVVGSVTDGFDIAGSHMVTVANNNCSGGAPSVGAHPDCVQLWSVKGTAVQSDIKIIDNIATGRTQGFDSFTPQWGGGLRITMTGNIVNNTYPQGMACYGCVDSIFTDNFLIAQPLAPHFTNMNIVGGSGNLIANNTFASTAERQILPTDYAEAYAVLTGKDYAGGSVSDPSLTAAVPEPDAWLMIVTGFGAVGLVLRSRHRRLEFTFNVTD